jgi:hypothetical protein
MKRLSIVSYYTGIYAYALKAQARRVLSNIANLKGEWEIHYIAVTDNSKEAEEGFDYYKELFGDKMYYTRIRMDVEDPNPVIYKEDAQLRIAQMTQAALNHARLIDSDYVWMVEADILPAHNSLRCLLDVLNFDDSYYNIAFAPYPSNGGGSFLGGYGSPTSHINKDFLPHERKLTKELQEKMDKLHKEELDFRKDLKQPPEDWIKEKGELDKEIDKCPPLGNIWDTNAKSGWRRRGWLDFAFPAIAKGAMVEIDWCGAGCTLLSKKALTVSHMDGYDGRGTQDLFLVWQRWKPAGLRIGLTTQALSDHVIKVRTAENTRSEKIVHLVAYYETQGEAINHIRWRAIPWYSNEIGEKFDAKNDGKLAVEQVNINKIQ